MERPIITIKIGGIAAEEQIILDKFIEDIKKLQEKYAFIVVHGGGKEISRISNVFGLQPVFKDGVRQTTFEEMKIVDMVLCGKMNSYMVRRFQSQGLASWGISGMDAGMIIAEPIQKGSFTGKIVQCDPRPLLTILQEGYIPLISPPAIDRMGTALNINADEAALHLSVAIKASTLLFLSDIPGIQKHNDTIKDITIEELHHEIDTGVISGGMVPKVTASIHALQNNLSEVIIGQFTESGDIFCLLDHRKGTHIVKQTGV